MTQQTGAQPRITQQLRQVVNWEADTRFLRVIVPLLLAIGSLYTIAQAMNNNWVMSGLSAFSVLLLLLMAAIRPVQRWLLGGLFDRSHVFYIALFWVHSLIAAWLAREMVSYPAFGKASEPFYIFFVLFSVVTLRAVLTLFALTPRGNRLFISRIPVWEQILVALNEFIAAALLAFVLGSKLAQWLQPHIFTRYQSPVYVLLILNLLFVYYVLTQFMWLNAVNNWLARNTVWVRLARLIAPLALLAATWLIANHFARLGDPRTATLLGAANVGQTILALSPVIWLLILFVVMLVYTGSKGPRQRFLPDELLLFLPLPLRNALATISDMDILLLCGVFMTFIPLHAFLSDDAAAGLLNTLSQQIATQNSIIDSSEQALALLFALPFWLMAAALLALYGYVLSRRSVSAAQRDQLVDLLPIGQLIVLIITLYLGSVPFSRVLSEGRLPQLPQELGRVLAFDVLIPLILLYGHYFILIRIPYGRGQALWRKQRAISLETELHRIDHDIINVQSRIRSIEHQWQMRRMRRDAPDEKFETLYQFIDFNSQRDHLNMERLRILGEKQALAEINEAPVSLTIARLPARVVSIGIPLLLAFKIYEWAVVNNGLREIANNPNIGVIEFFQTILQQAQF